MRILVIGGGGREHAIIRKIKENPEVSAIYALPGNGGIAADAYCVDVKATDLEGIKAFAAGHPVDYAVVAPDDPLAAGCVDMLEGMGIPCFGPRANAAIIEASKVFAKDLMKKYGIPTARYETFDDMGKALAYLEDAPIPTVIKADGLALGKGVIIAQTREEARAAVVSMMQDKQFGKSGERIVIEEFLEGPEVSVLSFTDGKTIVPMVSSMDHKRIGDGDTGLNTGGMGTIAPNPYYTPAIAKRCMDEIFLPTVAAMNAEGRPFKGCLYFGLMICQDGPKVIEYNCRFGDPETQVVLPLLESDLLTVMRAVTEERLDETEVKFADKSACCVILASGGYPGAYPKGFPMDIPADVLPHTYVAGAAMKDGQLVTAGGRVLGVTAVADDLPKAIEEAYEMAGRVRFEGAYKRNDIGARALQALGSKQTEE
ncbi:MAG: phosphoribosylamine--glycine ligase [Clostridia bacterium]|nr:phosphoribosylamine--glycine ligase [Clostridia bacterium]